MINVTEVDLASEEWCKVVADCVLKREQNDLYVSTLQGGLVHTFKAYVYVYGPLCMN